HAQRPNRTLGPEACDKVKKVLNCIHSVGWDVAKFMNALCWGDAECTRDSQVRFARAGFFNSTEFPRLLKRWWKPPSGKKNKSKVRMEEFARICVKQKIRAEMRKVASILARPDDPLSLETLTSL
ncbi:hypothetical protein BC834DRAFT_808451, partial [Gloeopeniophorella convolvens]